MTKLMSIITSRHNSLDKTPGQDHVPQRKMSMRKSLSINTSSSFNDEASTASTRTGSSISSSNTRPIVKSPDWSIRYDPTLSVYYYVNEKTNETQFDHPDEVRSPNASPITKNDLFNNLYDTDHRKIFSTSLKRTLSPKKFSHNNRSGNNSKSSSPRSSVDNTVIPSNRYKVDEIDEDVEEFRKQLALEMQNYECERLNSV